MTRPIHALAPTAALLALSLFGSADALAIPIGDAFPCVIAPFDEVPPPPPQPVVVVRPWSAPPPPQVVVRPYTPPPVVIVPRQPPPAVVVRPWTPPPPPAPTHVVVRPVTPAVVVAEPEPEPAPVDDRTDDEGGTIDDRGEGVRAARRVVVGGGFGGLMLAGPGSSTLSSAFGVHLGVALRQASVGLRLDMAPDAVDVGEGTARAPASYLIGGIGFGYHFNADSLIHPVVGASLDLHALDPEGGETRYGFGLGARAGLEMEYPLDSGSLGIGVDVRGHRRFGDSDDMPVAATALGFGGTIDYRF